MSPFVSPQPFLPPPFSLSLSLSLSCYFLSSFFSFFYFVSLFLSLSSVALFLGICVMKRTTSKNVLFLQSFLFLFFLSGSLSNSFILSLFFPHFKLCFLFNINALSFKKDKLKKTRMFCPEGGCNKTFLNNQCFAKCEKLSSFWPFWQILVEVQKHYKTGISEHLKSKKGKKHIFNAYYLVQVKVIIWSEFGVQKKLQTWTRQ